MAEDGKKTPKKLRRYSSLTSRLGALEVEHEMSKESLRLSELRYRQVLAAVPEAILLVDFDTFTIIDANERAADLYGYSRDELLKLGPDDLTAEPDASQEFSEDVVNGEDVLVPVRYHKKTDGTLFPVEIRVHSFALGDRATLCAVIREISPTDGPDDAAEISTEVYRNLVEGAGVAIEIDDENGEFRYCNQRFAELFGFTLEEIKQKSIASLVHPEDVGLVMGNHNARFSGEQVPDRYEFRGVRKDGSTVFLEVEVTELRVGSRLSGTRSYLWDVSDRKAAEEEMRLALEAAQAGTRAKGNFLDNMSHEIRTPMNSVLGMIDLVLASELNETQQHQLGVARRSAASLMQLLSDIIEYSNLDSGRASLDCDPIQMHSVIREVAEIFGPELHRKNLELNVDVSDQVPGLLRGDSGRLRQLLLTLVGNAVKFTDSGGVELRLTVQSTTDSEVVLRFDVADTGGGIEAEMLATITELFTQADDGLDRQYGGIGLGLALAARLVDLMGGEISFESEPDLGTLVSFTSRFAVAEDGEA